jgi:serine/threonine protein phosphatase PrpC
MQSIKIEYTTLTDVGLVREANEDSCGSIQGVNGQIFTVCDGMGGHVGGATASNIAVKTLLEFITTATIENPSIAINNAIISANQRILETVKQRPELKGMGTTATVLTVQPSGVYIGHVGDSRIYIFTNSKLHRLTRDHSFVQTLIDSGAITPEEAELHPRKNELTSAMGVLDVIQPTVLRKPIEPKPGDIFMLCSDGLCGLVSDVAMERILQTSANLDHTAQQLIAAAKSAGGYDNITLQLIKVIESPFRQSAFDSLSPQVRQHTTQIINMQPQVKSKQPALIQRIQQLSKKSMIIGLLALVAVASAAYVIIISNSQSSTNTPDIPGASIYLPGDTIIDNCLVHTVNHTARETLEQLTNDRENTPNTIYKQFDFKSTYGGNVQIAPEQLDDYTRIKWKKKAKQKEELTTNSDQLTSNQRIVVAADHSKTPTTKPETIKNDSPKTVVNKLTQKDSLLLGKKVDSLKGIDKKIAAQQALISLHKTDSLSQKGQLHPEKDTTKRRLNAELTTLKKTQTRLQNDIKALKKH